MSSLIKQDKDVNSLLEESGLWKVRLSSGGARVSIGRTFSTTFALAF
jgi:hypothetical protein